MLIRSASRASIESDTYIYRLNKVNCALLLQNPSSATKPRSFWWREISRIPPSVLGLSTAILSKRAAVAAALGVERAH